MPTAVGTRVLTFLAWYTLSRYVSIFGSEVESVKSIPQPPTLTTTFPRDLLLTTRSYACGLSVAWRGEATSRRAVLQSATHLHSLHHWEFRVYRHLLDDTSIHQLDDLTL